MSNEIDLNYLAVVECVISPITLNWLVLTLFRRVFTSWKIHGGSPILEEKNVLKDYLNLRPETTTKDRLHNQCRSDEVIRYLQMLCKQSLHETC